MSTPQKVGGALKTENDVKANKHGHFPGCATHGCEATRCRDHVGMAATAEVIDARIAARRAFYAPDKPGATPGQQPPQQPPQQNSPTAMIDNPYTPCIHRTPDAAGTVASELHGVCIFCWRDRLGAFVRENKRLAGEVERVRQDERQACIQAIMTLEPVTDPPAYAGVQAAAINDAIAVIQARNKGAGSQS